MDVIYLGAGCFWCVEAVYVKVKGVDSVTSGYMGGSTENPTYKEVCGGHTGHAEVIEIRFDQNVVSLDQLLQVFWKVHDPTTLNRQGADVGTQYRSAIFYTTDRQKETSIHSRETVGNLWWEGKVVTEISPATVFYIAENYHQNYYENNPAQAYCAFTIPPKLEKLSTSFPNLIKNQHE